MTLFEEDESGMTEAQRDVHDSAGAYQRELEDDVAGQQMGRKAPPPTHRDGSLGDKESPSTQEANPKRTKNSRPE